MSSLGIVTDANVSQIRPGLCLVGFQYVEATMGPSHTGGGEFSETKTVSVPASTTHVHIGITGVRMIGGTEDDPKYDVFNGMTFKVNVISLAAGTLNFKIEAQFIPGSLSAPWFGYLSATIMCFGPCG